MLFFFAGICGPLRIPRTIAGRRQTKPRSLAERSAKGALGGGRKRRREG